MLTSWVDLTVPVFNHMKYDSHETCTKSILLQRFKFYFVFLDCLP